MVADRFGLKRQHTGADGLRPTKWGKFPVKFVTPMIE
jgi:hypothetical protein